MLSIGPRYIYEHPYEQFRRTYIILYGKYKSGTVETYGFYKIDIGYLDDGVFTPPYNLLRNIHYHITVTSVLAPGMKTVSEVIDAAPFNNLSASTETRDMLNISDGVNFLIVNSTSHIIVDDNQKIDVLYRYLENIGTPTPEEDENNGIAHAVNLVAGPDKVIKSFTAPESTSCINSISQSVLFQKHKIKTFKIIKLFCPIRFNC